MLDILKILFCIPFLVYSCYSDIKTRRVTNKLWLIMLAGGAIFQLYDIWIYGIQHIFRILVSIGIIFIFVYIIFQLGVFGGADAKSLIALSFIFPFYPEFTALGYSFPLNEPLPIFRNFFSFDVFENAAFIMIPLSIFYDSRNEFPFMIPITLGTFISIFYGNLFIELIKYIILN